MKPTNDKTLKMEAVEMDETQERSRKDKVVAFFKKNKLQCGVVAGALVLILGGATFAIASSTSNGITPFGESQSSDTTHKTHFVKDENGNVVEVSEDTNGDTSTAQATDASDANNSSESADGSTLSTSDNGTSDNNGTSGDNGGSQGTTHTHTWTPVYTTVHHAAVTHTEPVYGKVEVGSAIYCTKHGCEITGRFCTQGNDHGTGYCLANHTTKPIYETRQTGTKTVTDSAAYDEQLIDHFTCSCGATK